MNMDRVIRVLESPTKDSINELLNDESTVFWVDWRQEDELIPESCDLVLQTGDLSGERVETECEDGYEVYVQYRDRRTKVPLAYSAEDRHITLCSLNRILSPDFEIRFCIDSNGNDTLAFLPLSCEQWTAFEQRYGEAVARRFCRIADRPNLFTDTLPF